MTNQSTGKREMLLSAAQELFERFGYRKTTIDDVVRRAGVAKGTLYLYFQGKEDLFQELIREIGREATAEYQEMLSTKRTAAEKIEATLRFSLEAYERYPLLAKITAMDEEFKLAVHSFGQAEMKAETERRIKFFRALFEEGIEKGELRDDIDLDIIPIVFASLKLMPFFKDLIAVSGISLEQMVDGLVDLAVNGITPRRARPDREGETTEEVTRRPRSGNRAKAQVRKE
jgi:AcrR family transcriptional regulator